MENKSLVLIILGMAIVTYLPRLLPAIFLAKKNLPDVIRTWLTYVPVGILSAMLFPSLLISDTVMDISLSNVSLYASIPTFLIAYYTRSLLITVILGITLVSIIKLYQ